MAKGKRNNSQFGVLIQYRLIIFVWDFSTNGGFFAGTSGRNFRPAQLQSAPGTWLTKKYTR
ncbi:TPA: hypothetical protein DDW35_06220 [Candidatus Sumerlaeota bacterium]|nr:hypothetical protein [Candidatus Sumerlaeota bacterium]